MGTCLGAVAPFVLPKALQMQWHKPSAASVWGLAASCCLLHVCLRRSGCGSGELHTK